MAAIHALAGGVDGKSWRVAMHFAVPDAANAVSVNYRTALVNSGLGGTTILPDGDGTAGTISAAEKAQIAAGEVCEHVATVKKLESGGTTPAELQATIRHFYQQLKADILGRLQVQLRYFGYVESES